MHATRLEKRYSVWRYIECASLDPADEDNPLPANELLERVLTLTGFKTLGALQRAIGKQKFDEISPELQKKLEPLFSYGANYGVWREPFQIQLERKTIVLPCPFIVVAKAPVDLQIPQFWIEQVEDELEISAKIAMTLCDVLAPRDENSLAMCDLLMSDGDVYNTSSDTPKILTAWLKANDQSPKLAKNEDFLSKLHYNVSDRIEYSIWIMSSISNGDDNDYLPTIDGEERGLSSSDDESKSDSE